MTIALVIVLIVTTWITLRDERLFERYLFRVDDILIRREFVRLISSGFLHADWVHLGFNAVSLYFFGRAIEEELSILQYLFLFLGSLIGGNLLALLIHRQHGDYSAVGASGAISGVMFAFTLLYPDARIGLILFPVRVDVEIFAFLYVLISIYGIKVKRGNIGHEAHLGGAVTGLLLAALLRPDALAAHRITFVILFAPTLIFLLLIWWKPEIMLIDGYAKYLGRRFKEKGKETPISSREKEIDRILDKISSSGYESLTRKEKQLLIGASREPEED